MIRYALKCSNDHAFDSWFQSAEAYDRLRRANLVACSTCGDAAVDKTLMTPAVQPARGLAAQAERPLSGPATEVEAALAALRREVEENSDYVGLNFAAEARAIHDGDAPERSIWGEARVEEARALLEDGVRVSPLPFRSPRKAN